MGRSVEDHGWIIHRIWSTDWFQRPQEQLQRVVAAIEAAKVELEARLEKRTAVYQRAVPIEVITIERHDVTEVGLLPKGFLGQGKPYQEAVFPVPSSTYELHEVPPVVMAELIRQVVTIEGPIHSDEIITRLRTLWGLQRAGGRIHAAVVRGVNAAVQAEMVVDEGNFHSIPGGKVEVRDRSAVMSASLRRPEMLPPCEIAVAILVTVRENLGATRDEIVLRTSRLLGFKAASTQLRAIIDARVDDMLTVGDVEQRGDMIAEIRSLLPNAPA